MRVLLALVVLTGPSFAQTAKPEPHAIEAKVVKTFFEGSCLPHSDMRRVLSENHQEILAGGGDSEKGERAELWKSRAGATWTVVFVLTNGLSCAVASGRNWLNR